MKNANVLGFCWTNWNEIVFITDQGIEFYQVIQHRLSPDLLLQHLCFLFTAGLRSEIDFT